MMKQWEKALIQANVTIREAIQAIDNSKVQIALVIGDNKSLIGTVTDGDVRRAILKGASLEDPVANIMNKKPTVASQGDSLQDILDVMEKTTHRCIPIVNKAGNVIDVSTYNKLAHPRSGDNWVVIMAGGLGTRLSPLTEECPKPLLKVGGKPILEMIVDGFREYGFCNFYLSVNYKAEMVKAYFGNGSRWGINIQYLEENKRMGTAGALSLLPEKPVKPIFVINGDLLTKVNFEQLLNFHEEYNSKATICVREYDLQVPYGVVDIDGFRIAKIDEKPIHRFFVNAGIYVLDPSTLDRIPPNEFYDMPELFQELIKDETETAVFPLREYWLDVGQLDDFRRANGEYHQMFE